MKMLALLRGINVGGNRKVSMSELQSVAVEIGFTKVETYINSGNLVFESRKLSAAKASEQLEKAIEKHFGFPVDVVVRTAKQWNTYASENPFPKAADSRPNLLMIGLPKLPLAKNTFEILVERSAKNEQIKIVNDVIWVDFANGSGKSKLTPLWFEKASGSPVTLRNWRTLLKLEEILAGQ